jgi:predicted dehydrogenase
METPFHGKRPPLRGALIGFGNVAVQAHLPSLLKDGRFTVEAIVESDPLRAELAGRTLPGVRVYSGMEQCLEEKRPDFVDICTPSCFHPEQVLRGCTSGVHVLCEKPLWTSTQELQRIHGSATTCEKVVFVVNNWKHAPLWKKAIELVRSNAIGQVQDVTLSVLRTPGSGGGLSDWRRCLEIAGGGILLDHGWHNLYLILSIIGEKPLSVSATLEKKGSELEEIVDLAIRFEEAKARLHMTWHAPSRRNEGKITGERGTLSILDDRLLLATDDGLQQDHLFPEALSGGSHHPDWMTPVVEDFYREVTGQGDRGQNFREAMQCAQLIDSAYRSHREGSAWMPVNSSFSSWSDS